MSHKLASAMPARAYLDCIVAKAMEDFNALSPEAKRDHREAQRKSYVVGELLLSNPNLTREQAEATYERAK